MTVLASNAAIGDNQLVIDTPFPDGSFPAYIKIDDEILTVGGQDNRGTTLVLSVPVAATHTSGDTVIFAGRPWDADFLTATGGGGGGEAAGQAILSETVTLINAQILALPTTYIEMVAAPGAGFVLIPVMAIFAKHFDAGAYTNDSGFCALYIADGTSNQVTNLVKRPEATAADHKIHVATSRANIPDQEDVFAGFLISNDYTPNSSLSVAAATDDGLDFGGGDAANTLKVTLLYMVIGA